MYSNYYVRYSGEKPIFSLLFIFFHMKYSANCTVDVANKNNATYLSFGLFLYNNNPVTTKPP